MTSEQGSEQGRTGQAQPRPLWTLSEAAQRCDVSRSTIRRYRESGKFPNAVKRSGEWVVPVEDLLAAGLRPTAPPSEQAPPTEQAHPEPEQVTQLERRVIELEALVQVEQAHRAAAEQVAAERERALSLAENALRMLEAPRPRPAEPDPGTLVDERPATEEPATRAPAQQPAAGRRRRSFRAWVAGQ